MTAQSKQLLQQKRMLEMRQIRVAHHSIKLCHTIELVYVLHNSTFSLPI